MTSATFEHYNVTFLLDANPPTRTLLLKRAATKSFAPLWYTGIGGHMEAGETIEIGAMRELKEETGLTGIVLQEFSRCIVNNKIMLHFMVGYYDQEAVPSCNEGMIEWVALKDIKTKPIIPTTLLNLEEWERRSFAVSAPWTLWTSREEDLTQPVSRDRLEEGLRD